MGLKLRRDTAANWTSDNPTLEQGEQGYETDTKKLKVGDGTTAWTGLGYWPDTSGLVPTSRQVNGHALSADVTLALSDLGYIATLATEQSVNGGGGTADQTLWTPAAIAAADLAVGQFYELQLGGNFDNIATSGLFTVDLKQGSTVIAAVPVVATSITGAQSAQAWWANLIVRVDAIGSTGGLTVIGNSVDETTAGAGINPRAIRAVSTLLNLSTSFAPVVAGKLGTANAGNIIRLTSALMRRIA